MGGSSDAPVITPNVREALRDAVLRETAAGVVLGQRERLSIEDALQMYTRDAAFLARADHLVGNLEPGKYADLVVLAADPTAVAPRDLPNVAIRQTIVGGRPVHGREPIPAPPSAPHDEAHPMIDAPRYEAAAPWELRLEGTNPDVPAVAVNSRGEVHILTRSPHPVLVFDQGGRFLRSWGEGIFTTTHGMTIGPDDCVYIVDAADSTVRKFSPDGREQLLQLGSAVPRVGDGLQRQRFQDD